MSTTNDNVETSIIGCYDPETGFCIVFYTNYVRKLGTSKLICCPIELGISGDHDHDDKFTFITAIPTLGDEDQLSVTLKGKFKPITACEMQFTIANDTQSLTSLNDFDVKLTNYLLTVIDDDCTLVDIAVTDKYKYFTQLVNNDDIHHDDNTVNKNYHTDDKIVNSTSVNTDTDTDTDTNTNTNTKSGSTFIVYSYANYAYESIAKFVTDVSEVTSFFFTNLISLSVH